MSADRAAELLLLWEEAGERGEPVTPEELCRDCPELLGELQRRIRALQTLNLTTSQAGAPTVDAQPSPDTAPKPEAGGERAISVPGYELLSVLGRGGMGVVYKARQIALDRVVALKMILAGAHAGAGQRERFRKEAEAVARLQHPNIVQVFEVGEHEGHAYFTLEYVAGRGLRDVLFDALPMPLDAAALA